MEENLSLSEKREKLNAQIENLDKKFASQVESLIEARANISAEISDKELRIKQLKEEQTQIDAELMVQLQDAGMDQEVKYFGGLRMEFKEEIVGSIEPGMEENVIQWARNIGNEDLVKVSIGKRAIGKLVDSGIAVPMCLKINTYTKFNVRKDTRKKGG